MVVDSLSPEHVEILSVRLPRVTREQAVQWLLERLAQGATTPVCFPDMSTLNIASKDRAFQDILNRRFHPLNDGASLEWAARRLGRPLPENPNGTDLCPMLLSRVPPGTRIYLLGVPTFIGRCLQAESTASLQGRRGAIPKIKAD